MPTEPLNCYLCGEAIGVGEESERVKRGSLILWAHPRCVRRQSEFRDDRSPNQRVSSPERSCPICARGEPLDVVAELATIWVTAQVEAPLPGYVCVVAKRHVVEPFDLPEPELIAFWQEAMLAARTVNELFRPTKMNYEIHGNTIPHLHMHLYPRFASDPYVGRPIDARLTPFSRSQEELRAIRRAFERIKTDAGGSDS
jgi:diadenosine tetraphosphate (Ap4A) HIT family hydrolase